MTIHGFNRLTLLDYPGKLACTIFSGHCNFRCPFCHNAGLVLDPASQPVLDAEYVTGLIKKREKTIEGIVITGGEPTLQKDLPDFIRNLRDETGLLIKLDTNGTDPVMLKKLIDEQLIDYAAMDIKASPNGYARASGLSSVSMSEIFDSVSILITSDIEYEFRTTVVDGIHSEQDFTDIGRWIKGARHYYLQRYRDSKDIIAPLGLSSPSPEQLERYRELVLPFVPGTELRGV